MILTIIVTGLCVVNLLLLNAMKHRTREITCLAVMSGILTVQTAHNIFEGVVSRQEDYLVMANAAFTILYLPVLLILYFVITDKTKMLQFWIPGCAVTLFFFLYLYYQFFVVGSIPVISYANLIWLLGVSAMIGLIAEIWSVGKRRKSPAKLVNSYSSLIRVWCLILLAPYVVPLIAGVFPPDNFIFSYHPVATADDARQVVTGLLLLIFGGRIIRHRMATEKAHSIGRADRKLKDLAF